MNREKYNRPMGLLWFRRSRGKETKPEPEAPPAATQFQSRLPLKLRGLLLLNLKATDGLDQIETAPPLGPRATVITALQDWIPGISFDDQGKGEVAAADHRLALDIGPHAEVHAAVASAEGDTAIELLRRVLEREGWRAYAPKAGVFIEPDALDLFALPDDAPPGERI
jgi:hypothetical protein